MLTVLPDCSERGFLLVVTLSRIINWMYFVQYSRLCVILRKVTTSQTNKNFQSNFLLMPHLTQHVSCFCHNPTLSKLSTSCLCIKHSCTSEEILACWPCEYCGKIDGDRATGHSEMSLILCRELLTTRAILPVSYEMFYSCKSG